MNTEGIASIYKAAQTRICKELETADGAGIFREEKWEKPIGGGLTRKLVNGKLLEKAAVNFSQVAGAVTPALEKLLAVKASRYSATGISSIIHPKNPFVPVIHLNVRYFETDSGQRWFGGGIDLTPHYVEVEEAAAFHHSLKKLCDHFDLSFYPRFKAWADDYFYLPHRQEIRGVGGIFFDRLEPADECVFRRYLRFTVELAMLYPRLYNEILQRKAALPYNETHRKWQQFRRGRYVEFNLIYDRGTRFGLESGGRTESILLSLPPLAEWDPDFLPQPGSAEKETLEWLKKDINWIEKLSAHE